MSEQPEAAKTQHAEPKLCKMGCGFFGSNATGDCCSKCWSQIRPKDDKNGNATTEKKQTSTADINNTKTSPVEKAAIVEQPAAENTASTTNSIDAPAPGHTTSTEKNTPMDTATAAPSPEKKKKKKKASYKNMMAGMMQESSRDVEKEKEKLKAVTGGGKFSKIDKI
ncbi:predicted protein [Thalassiosira pseudonana CCMP1335]|uniref:A20-type domain-containing protein n=1 Tax=Thalassiosira pseudonana TaxID=35128 RepID=B8BRJ1_THAPS|nr:predicted protein [Thalassiosira pseudonana CCMP1335]EED96550.1 predicted protein [Thalassiosira pseudonana CCMP1335]